MIAPIAEAVVRCALYARYSSDRQNPRSIDQQFDLLRRHAESRGWAVVACFQDDAISGEHLANRPGMKALLGEAAAGGFDVVLAEDETRVARSLEYLAHVKTRLNFFDVRLATLETDDVDDLRTAIKGLLGADELNKLRHRTRRGMADNAKLGKAVSGKLFGYATRPGGEIWIEDAEAEVIRRIYRLYVGGATGREIAAALNAEGVPSPGGGRWNRSTITGHSKRANGILQTPQYAGRRPYGRVRKRKDPDTGRHIDEVLPRESWTWIDVPELRIVDQETWDLAQARKQRDGARPPWDLALGRPRGLFTGLLKCGRCGGSYITSSSGRLRCATRLENHGCDNARTLKRDLVEEKTLAGLRELLASPAAVRAYVRAYHAAYARQRAQEEAQRAPIEKRLAELDRSIGRLVDAIARVGISDAVQARLQDEEAERARLKDQLAATAGETKLVEMHPGAGEIYAGIIGELQARLTAGARPQTSNPADRRLLESVRRLIDRIVITPEGTGRAAPFRIELYGRLAAFLQPPPEGEDVQCMRRMVAGGRIELPT